MPLLACLLFPAWRRFNIRQRSVEETKGRGVINKVEGKEGKGKGRFPRSSSSDTEWGEDKSPDGGRLTANIRIA